VLPLCGDTNEQDRYGPYTVSNRLLIHAMSSLLYTHDLCFTICSWKSLVSVTNNNKQASMTTMPQTLKKLLLIMNDT